MEQVVIALALIGACGILAPGLFRKILFQKPEKAAAVDSGCSSGSCGGCPSATSSKGGCAPTVLNK